MQAAGAADTAPPDARVDNRRALLPESSTVHGPRSPPTVPEHHRPIQNCVPASGPHAAPQQPLPVPLKFKAQVRPGGQEPVTFQRASRCQANSEQGPGKRRAWQGPGWGGQGSGAFVWTWLPSATLTAAIKMSISPQPPAASSQPLSRQGTCGFVFPGPIDVPFGELGR